MKIEDSQDFTRTLNRVKRDIKTRGKATKLEGSIHMICEFRILGQKHLKLANLIATTEKLMYAAGVFNGRSYNIVKSVDGSKIVQAANEEDVGTLIHLRAVE
jgi:hypothetical protein